MTHDYVRIFSSSLPFSLSPPSIHLSLFLFPFHSPFPPSLASSFASFLPDQILTQLETLFTLTSKNHQVALSTVLLKYIP